MPAQTVIQLRRGTAAQWVSAQTAAGSTPVLAAGEQGYETDTGKLKVGDGTTLWGSLAYANGGGSIPQSQVTNLTSDLSGKMTNPMTTVGDLIVGGTVTSGIAAPARLGIGTTGQVLTVSSGSVTWSTPATPSVSGETISSFLLMGA